MEITKIVDKLNLSKTLWIIYQLILKYTRIKDFKQCVSKSDGV